MSLIFSEGGVGGVTEEELQAAVNELQGQIDTISAASDCADIVGTYIDLQNYDTSTLSDNAIIKVLNDSTHDGAPSYYRWSTSTEQFTYIGSESRVNDGTLTIKYGTETVGTFSANQSTNATVNLPSTDLSNYYNKAETDTLLDEKQDVLTPQKPINIITTSKNPMHGFTTISGNNNVVYSDGANNSNVPKSNGLYAPRAQATFATVPTTDKDSVFWNSYIDIPYSFGQIVASGSPYSSSYATYYGNVIFGYYEDNDFIPVLTNTDGTISIITDASSYQLSVDRESLYRTYINGANFGASRSSASSAIYGSYYGALSQIIDNGQGGYDLKFLYDNFMYKTISDSAQVAAISKITTAKVISDPNNGPSSSYPIDISNVGVYAGTLADTPYTLTTSRPSQGDLGANLFDIDKPTVTNSINLSIGTGLAVSNGALVNTNPTAPTVMTGADGTNAGTSGLVPAPAATDNTKFLAGDGTYKTVASPDMSNYYNKSETDTKLAEKQNILTPNDPLTISTYTKSNLVGFSYADSSHIYSTSEQQGECYEIYDGDNNIIVWSYDAGWVSTSAFSTTVENFKSYIDVPIRADKMITIPQNMNAIIGYYNENGIFMPIAGPRNYFRYGDGSGYWFQYDSYNYRYYLKDNVTQISQTPVSLSYVPYTKIYLTQTSSGVRLHWSSNYQTSSNGYYVDINGELPVVSKIAVARITRANNSAGYSVNTAIDVSDLGVYAYTGNFADFDPTGLTNEFDISGVQSYNYLDLHIGSGLAVQNGNLVNTNPTPADLSTYIQNTYTTDMTRIGIGSGSEVTTSGATAAVAIGNLAHVTGEGGVAVGGGTSGSNYTRAENYGTAVGGSTYARANYATAYGYGADANTQYATAIGAISSGAGQNAVAIGYGAIAASTNSIQIGEGRNTDANTLQIGNYELLNTSTGKIPDARLNSTVLLTSTGVSSTTIRTIVSCTQSEYDALVSGGTIDANTFYVIVPASNS